MQLILNGLNKMQKYVHNVEFLFKKTMDVTTCNVINVNLNFVGFVYKIGKNIQEQVIFVIK